jgi:hypothetical protein
MTDSLKQLVALNTIVITTKEGQPGDRNAGIAPTPPETKEIPRDAQFKARSAEEQEQLLAMGAARIVEKDEVLPEGEQVSLAPSQTNLDPEQGRLELLRRDYFELTGKEADRRLSSSKLGEEVEKLRKQNPEPTGTQNADQKPGGRG